MVVVAFGGGSGCVVVVVGVWRWVFGCEGLLVVVVADFWVVIGQTNGGEFPSR